MEISLYYGKVRGSQKSIARSFHVLEPEGSKLLPLGSIVYVLFCVTRYGWGWDSFVGEANTGKGLKLPRWIRPYMTFGIPAVILVIFVQGYFSLFTK